MSSLGDTKEWQMCILIEAKDAAAYTYKQSEAKAGDV